MTRHRLFVAPKQLQDGSRVKLTADQSRHLTTVLRLRPGAELEVFDGAGHRFRSVLIGAEVEIESALPEETRSSDVVLVQALAKGDKMDLVVQKATELGVSRILPLAADRAVVRLEKDRSASRVERWRRIAQEAARQCGRADVPAVGVPAGWPEVFSLLRSEPERRPLLLDPEETGLRLGAAARGVSRLLLAVGPEGGFSALEKGQAMEAGFLPVALGPRVLRTETAGMAALAIVLHVHGELG